MEQKRYTVEFTASCFFLYSSFSLLFTFMETFQGGEGQNLTDFLQKDRNIFENLSAERN